jgi:hypothetical protein
LKDTDKGYVNNKSGVTRNGIENTGVVGSSFGQLKRPSTANGNNNKSLIKSFDGGITSLKPPQTANQNTIEMKN